jgi:hypothetical protein
MTRPPNYDLDGPFLCLSQHHKEDRRLKEDFNMGLGSLGRILIIAGLGLAGLGLESVVSPVRAGTITYTTTTGATTSGGPVRDVVTFTTSAGALTITLQNLQANPKDDTQALNGLSFTVGNGSLTGAKLSTSSGQEITIAKGGTFTLGPTVSTGWAISTSSNGTTETLSVLGTKIGPKHLIVGPVGIGGTYSNANSSIAGNKAHNPFLNQFATFTINVPGITAATTVKSATFSLSTALGTTVPGIALVPEPTSLVSSLIGLGLVGMVGIYRSQRRQQVAA